LTFGIDGVERQGRLSRSRRTRHHSDGSPWDLQIEAFEVMLPGAADDDTVFHIPNLSAAPKICRIAVVNR